MPSMHVPCPQHRLLHGCSKGKTKHWSPSATQGGVGGQRPETPSGAGAGSPAGDLERTHRRAWTRRPAAGRAGSVRRLQPVCGGGAPGWGRAAVSGQGREGLPDKQGSTPDGPRPARSWCSLPLPRPASIPRPWSNTLSPCSCSAALTTVRSHSSLCQRKGPESLAKSLGLLPAPPHSLCPRALGDP